MFYRGPLLGCPVARPPEVGGDPAMYRIIALAVQVVPSWPGDAGIPPEKFQSRCPMRRARCYRARQWLSRVAQPCDLCWGTASHRLRPYRIFRIFTAMKVGCGAIPATFVVGRERIGTARFVETISAAH